MPLCSDCDGPAASNAYEMQAAFLSMLPYHTNHMARGLIFAACDSCPAHALQHV